MSQASGLTLLYHLYRPGAKTLGGEMTILTLELTGRPDELPLTTLPVFPSECLARGDGGAVYGTLTRTRKNHVPVTLELGLIPAIGVTVDEVVGMTDALLSELGLRRAVLARRATATSYQLSICWEGDAKPMSRPSMIATVLCRRMNLLRRGVLGTFAA